MKLSTPVTVLAGLGVVSGVPTTETLGHIARGFAARIQRRDASYRTNTTVIDTTWKGVTLLKQGLPATSNTTALTTADRGVEITCESCYIKGGFTASLKVKGNSTDTLTKYTDEAHDSVRNVTQTAFNQITEGLQGSTPTIPTVNVDFDLDLAPLPGVSAQFQFNEGLELYMLLNTKVSIGSTYIVNLYSAKTPLDITIGSNITTAVALNIDLVLTSRDTVDATSGFHLRLDKGASMEFDLFSSNVSNVAIPSGHFEFLPVTLVSPSATLTGALRITLAAGFDYNTGVTVLNNTPVPFSAGLVSQVVANLAEFTTDATIPSTNTTCIPLSETYNLAVGAASGATISLGPNVWGPSPASAIPLYHTTLTSACASRGTPLPPSSSSAPTTTPDTTTTLTTTSTATRTTTTTTPPPTATLLGRQAPEDRVTTTLLTTIFYTGVSCLSPATNALGCPASLQSSSVYASVATHVTVVAPGVVVSTFPASALPPAAVTGAGAVPFGGGVQGFVMAVEGGQTAFVASTAASTSSSSSGTSSTRVPTSTGTGARPTVTPTGGAEAEEGQRTWLDGKTGGVANRVLVGVGVGVGVPVLAGVVGGIVYLIRRRSYRRLGSRPGTPSQTVTNNNVYAVFAPPPARTRRRG
ncbi:hypothetical protein QBC39DRAFT_412772 [Podospora conica]|nr:hypothetical protein QBC39DRAFT_412772 [Schizothecium conicum]